MLSLGQLDPRRSVEDECGFPPVDAPVDPWLYRNLWERNSLAARATEVMAKEAWQVSPRVFELEDANKPTEFELAWDELGKSLIPGSKGWHAQEEGSPVWEYLLRADVLSGIGQYGIILLGLDDVDQNRGLDRPVKGVEEAYSAPGKIERDPKGLVKKVEAGKVVGNYVMNVDPEATKGRRLAYLRAYPEHNAPVVQWESNPSSPRYGQPVMYNVTLNDYRDYGGIGISTSTVMVHWTRVIHIADTNHTSAVNECYAVPRMRPFLNNLLGLHKLYGGSPEMYWRGAFPGISLETHPQLGGDVDVDTASLKDEMEEYFNGLQRYFTTSGMTAKTLSPTVVDPTPMINAQIEAICIKIGCPVRVFKGSERGELASSQDDAAWNDRLKQRQNGYITPRIICPFIDRLIMVGVLPEPLAEEVAPTVKKLAKPVEPVDVDVDVEEEEEVFNFGGPPGGPPKFGGGPPGVVPGMPPPAPPKPKKLLPKGAEAKTRKPGYRVEWDDITSQTTTERATVAAQTTTALSAYVSGGVQALFPPMDFLVRVLGYDEEEALAILQSAEDLAAEEEAEAEADAATALEEDPLFGGAPDAAGEEEEGQGPPGPGPAKKGPIPDSAAAGVPGKATGQAVRPFKA